MGKYLVRLTNELRFVPTFCGLLKKVAISISRVEKGPPPKNFEGVFQGSQKDWFLPAILKNAICIWCCQCFVQFHLLGFGFRCFAEGLFCFLGHTLSEKAVRPGHCPMVDSNL